MGDLLTMNLLDLSTVVGLLILAYLSRKMGDALKIRPYYVVLYIAAALILVSCGLDIASKVSLVQVSYLSIAVRCCACAAAIGVSLRYWGWLFSEFFGI